MNQQMHASWQEFRILNKAGIEQAGHLIYALHDYPSASIKSLEFEMEYATGRDFGAYLRNNPQLSISKQLALWIGRQILCGLRLLHSHSIMHTDLKTDNICPFFEKPSKSILSGAQCVAAAQQKKWLARFLNKRAVLTHIGLSAVFSWNLASPFWVVHSVLLRHNRSEFLGFEIKGQSSRT